MIACLAGAAEPPVPALVATTTSNTTLLWTDSPALCGQQHPGLSCAAYEIRLMKDKESARG